MEMPTPQDFADQIQQNALSQQLAQIQQMYGIGPGVTVDTSALGRGPAEQSAALQEMLQPDRQSVMGGPLALFSKPLLTQGRDIGQKLHTMPGGQTTVSFTPRTAGDALSYSPILTTVLDKGAGTIVQDKPAYLDFYAPGETVPSNILPNKQQQNEYVDINEIGPNVTVKDYSQVITLPNGVRVTTPENMNWPESDSFMDLISPLLMVGGAALGAGALSNAFGGGSLAGSLGAYGEGTAGALAAEAAGAAPSVVPGVSGGLSSLAGANPIEATQPWTYTAEDMASQIAQDALTYSGGDPAALQSYLTSAGIDPATASNIIGDFSTFGEQGLTSGVSSALSSSAVQGGDLLSSLTSGFSNIPAKITDAFGKDPLKYGATALTLLGALKGQGGASDLTNPFAGGTAGSSGGPWTQQPPLARTVDFSGVDWANYGKGPMKQFVKYAKFAQGGPVYRRGGLQQMQEAPRMQGPIRGPGGGKDDLIDAKLGNGEYVLDADTVADIGDGSSDEGARRLDQMRQRIRRHKGRAKVSPKAKRPEQYLKGGA